MQRPAANVRVFHKAARPGVTTDTPAIARARVALKLASLAYASSRHGADASAQFSAAATLLLCKAAVAYTRALEGRTSWTEPAYNRVHPDQLRLAALAWVESRHGADGGPGFCRDGLGNLCQAAIDYAQALDGEDKSTLKDHGLLSDSGM